MFALHPPSDAISIEPRRIKLFRNGTTFVHYQAPLVGEQTFTFTVSRRDTQTSIRTLKVTDSRGTEPLVSFPAPPPGTPTRTYHSPNEPVLAQAATARAATQRNGNMDGPVALSTPSRLDADGNLTPGEMIHLSNGKLLAEQLSDVALTSKNGLKGNHFDGVEPSDIEQLLPHTVPHASIPVIVKTCGEGHGLLEISYETMSPHVAAFFLNFTIQPPSNDTGGPLYTWENAIAKGFVKFFNPLHVELRGVDVELTDLHRYKFSDGMSYEPAVVCGLEKEESQDGTESHKNDSSGGESDDDSSTCSLNSIDSLLYQNASHDVSYEVRNVSLGVGKGMSAPIPDAVVDVRSTEVLIERSYKSISCIGIRNKTDTAIPNALWHIPVTAGREWFQCGIPRLDSGKEWFAGFTRLGVLMVRDFKFGEQTECARSVCDGTLHAVVERRRVATFRLQNFQPYELDCTAILNAQDPEFDDEVKMVLYGDDGKEISGHTKKLPTFDGHHMFCVTVGGKQQVRFEVTQKIYKHRVYQLDERLGMRVVGRLKAGGTDASILSGLEKFVATGARVKTLKLRRKMCKRSLHAANEGAQRAAKSGVDGNVRFKDEDVEKSEGAETGLFEQAVEKAMKSVARWDEEVDRVAVELLDAKDAMTAAIVELNGIEGSGEV